MPAFSAHASGEGRAPAPPCSVVIASYDELRRLAALRLRKGSEGNTLQPTALVNEAFSRLERMSPQQARVVELRFFAGLALEEIAEVLERSRASVFRDWRMAKTWLFRELSGSAR